MPIVRDPFDVSDDEQRAVKDAMPNGWHASPLSIDVALDGREPRVTYRVTFHWGVEIEGGRTRYYYGGESSIQPTHRRLDVEVRAGSMAQLADFARHLSALEAMTGLAWPLSFSIEGFPFPD
ncbi:MAG: hypothetical protein RL139_100 [Gemmatimonadota bacterium]|jgi:hypothetical protein